MASFAFLICSTLLICGAIAAPYPGEESDASPAAALAASPELEAQVHKQAEKSAKKVLEDVVAGKDVHESLVEQTMGLGHKIMKELHSMGHSLLKRWDELKRGDSVLDVAGRWWHSMVRKISTPNDAFDSLVEKFGSDKIKSFTKSAAKMIESVVKPAAQKGQELKESDVVVNKEAEAKLTKLAEEFKEKA